MALQIYLFNEGSAAAVYGIGTYIRQMVAILSSCIIVGHIDTVLK